MQKHGPTYHQNRATLPFTFNNAPSTTYRVNNNTSSLIQSIDASDQKDNNNEVYRRTKHMIRWMIFDENGTKYITSLIKPNSQCAQINFGAVSLVITHLIDLHRNDEIQLTALSCHKFGSNIISLLFDLCNDFQLELLVNACIYQAIETIFASEYGHPLVIKLLSILKNKNKKDILFKLIINLKNKMMQINRINKHLSMLVQKILELNLSYDIIKVIADALKSQLSQFCGNVYASRIVQKYVALYGSGLNIRQLFDDRDSYFALSKSPYGNYTIQAFIRRDESYSNVLEYSQFRHRLLDDIFIDSDKLIKLSVNKYGSKVIETCISAATRPQIGKLVNTLCIEGAVVLKEILSSDVGNYIAKALLSKCEDYKYERKCIIDAVDRNVYQMDMYAEFDKHCINGNVHLQARYLKQCARFIQMCHDWYQFDKYNKTCQSAAFY